MMPTTQKWEFFGAVSEAAAAVANHLETMRRALETAELSPNPQLRRTARIRYLGTLGTLVAACPTLHLAPPHQMGYSLREPTAQPPVLFTSLLGELIWIGYWLVDDSATDAGDRNGLAWVGQYLLQNEAEIDLLLPEVVNALGLLGVPQTSYSISQFGVLLAWARELQQCAPEQIQFAEIARLDAEHKRSLHDSSILQDLINQLFASVYQRRARDIAASLTAAPREATALLEACVLYHAAGNPKAGEELQYRVWDASKREISLDEDEWERAKINSSALAREYMRAASANATTAPSLLPSTIPRAPMGDHARWFDLCAHLSSAASHGPATRHEVAPRNEVPTPLQIMTAAALLADSKMSAEGKKWLQNWFWTRLNWDADTGASSWSSETQQWTTRINAATREAAPQMSFGDRLKSWLAPKWSTPAPPPTLSELGNVFPHVREERPHLQAQPQTREVELDEETHAEMALQWALAAARKREQ